MMMKRLSLLKYILCFIASAMLVSCGESGKRGIVVTVSIEPQRYLLEQIVGDKVAIECVLSQGNNPETFEPSLKQLMQLEQSSAYFCIGNIAFEQSLVEKAKSNNSALQVFMTAEGIEVIRGTHGEHAHGHEHSHEVDPHTWTSVRNAMVIARNMCEAMCGIDAVNADFYKKNFEKLIADLQQLDASVSERLQHRQSDYFIVWHPSLSYFARDYGLHQISMEFEGKEMPAKMLKHEIDEAKESGANVFFYQKEFDSRQIETINAQIGARLVEVNLMNYDWKNEINKITDALTTKETN